MSKKTKSKILVETTREGREKLRQIANADGRLMSKIIELALDEYAKKRKIKLEVGL